MSGYIGPQPVPQAVMFSQTFTATASQTSFATRGYQPGFLQVFLNGSFLDPSEYTATNGSDIVLNSGASASDQLTVWVWTPFEAAWLNALDSNVDGNGYNITNLGSVNVADGSAAAPSIANNEDTNTGLFFPEADTVGVATAGSERVRFHDNGDVTVGGTTSVGKIGAYTGTNRYQALSGSLGDIEVVTSNNSNPAVYIKGTGTADLLQIFDDTTQVVTVKDGGNVGIKTSSPDGTLHVHTGSAGTVTATGVADDLVVENSVSAGVSILSPDAHNATLTFGSPSDNDYFYIQGFYNSGSPFVRFTVNGSERMRINSSGTLIVGGITEGAASSVSLNPAGYIWARQAGPSAFFDRTGNDGVIVSLRQDGTDEGSISVSGTTVSYNGAHLSRWFQVPGVGYSNIEDRPEILRGSVLTNLDEMCDWEGEDNEQLNKMEVSSVKGDKNVAGVFQDWDDDDDVYLNDGYCAMTGDFIIRIAADCTVERGDLLMSAGDGTACPQEGELADVVRSCTVAKVTSKEVSHTYDDGSYLVPCVLMVC